MSHDNNITHLKSRRTGQDLRNHPAVKKAEEQIERVMRAIAHVREQNGAPPYDGWDTIYGKATAQRLRRELAEEARAAIRAM